jgi:hypothetical protein
MSSLNPNNGHDILLTAGLGNAASTAVEAAGVFTLHVFGTWSSNTAKLQTTPDAGTTWIDYPGASFTADGQFAPVYLGAQQQARMINTGGTIKAILCLIP